MPITATSVFLAYHDSMVAACCLQVRNTVIVTGWMQPWSWRARQPCTQPSRYPWPIIAAWWQHAVPSQENCHPSVLCCRWLGDRKGIRLVNVMPQQFLEVYFWGLT